MATKKEDADQIKDEQEVDETEEVDEETQDESDDTEDDQDDSDDQETADDGEDDDAEASDDDEDSDESETFDKRFTQFKGDDLPEYAKNLEEGYAQSTAEAQRLVKENADYKLKIDRITAAVANDPELAERLNVSNDSPDPALNYARQEMVAKQKTEYDGFLQEHPEVETDPALGERLLKRVTTISKAVYDDEGRMLGMGEALGMAWSSLGLGNNQEETTRMAAKNVAAQSRTASSKKPTPKSEFTPAQLDFAQKMGLSEKELRESVKS